MRTEILLIELILNLILGCIGLVASLAIAPRWSPWSRASLAFPLGAAAVVWLNIPLLVAGVGIRPLIVLQLALAACLFVGAFSARGHREFAHSLVFSVALIGGVTIVANWLDLSVFSFDSYQIMMIGSGMRSPEALAVGWHRLASYPVFTAVLHGLGSAVGLDYLRSASPLFMVSAFGTAFVFVDRFHDQVRRSYLLALYLLPAAFLVSSPFFLHQSFYVNSHAAMGCFVVISFLSIWFARIRDRYEDSGLIAASLACIAILRLEGMLVAALLSVLIASTENWSRQNKVLTLTTVIAPSALWYGSLVAHGSSGDIVDPTKLLALFAVLRFPPLCGMVSLILCSSDLVPV